MIFLLLSILNEKYAIIHFFSLEKFPGKCMNYNDDSGKLLLLNTRYEQIENLTSTPVDRRLGRLDYTDCTSMLVSAV